MQKGMHHLQEAVQIDPSYAPAHVLLAHALSVLGYWGQLPIEGAYPQATQAAARAVELDDSLGEAHSTAGLMKWLSEWDLAGAEEGLKRGVELSPLE